MSNPLSNQYISSFARLIIGAAGGALVNRGYIEASSVEPLTGAFMMLGAFAWSVFEKKKR